MSSDKTLLEKARQLDPQSLETIFDSYYDPLYRFIYLHVNHVETAEDLTAQVFSRLLESLVSARGPDHHLRGWLYRVARNLIVDEARRAQHRDHLALENIVVAVDDVEETANMEIDSQRVGQALGHLTINQRMVLQLKYMEGLSNSEIAQAMDLSVGAVKALEQRAFAALRNRLEPSDPALSNPRTFFQGKGQK